MSLRRALVRQFGRPEGAFGELAGWVMAVRPSNRERNAWAVGLLDVRPGHRVLEIGCGPGIAIAECAPRAAGGLVVGLDHSPVMVRQATRRNRVAIEKGIVQIRLGDVGSLPLSGGPFDRILAVNVVQFLAHRQAALHALREALVPGGCIALAHQPRNRRAARADALRAAMEFQEDLGRAGFTRIRTEELALRPAPAVCVLGQR